MLLFTSVRLGLLYSKILIYLYILLSKICFLMKNVPTSSIPILIDLLLFKCSQIEPCKTSISELNKPIIYCDDPDYRIIKV